MRKLAKIIMATAIAGGAVFVSAPAAHASNEIIVTFDSLGWEANPVIDILYRGVLANPVNVPMKTCTLPAGVTTAGAGPIELCRFDNDFKVWRVSIREGVMLGPEGSTNVILPKYGYLYPGTVRTPYLKDWNNTDPIKTVLTRQASGVYELKFFARDEAPVAPPTALMALSSTPCTITGTPEDDILMGTSDDDVICGLGGDDIIYARGGNDVIFGGGGNDLIAGGAGNDTIYGGSGNDRVAGGSGGDTLLGGYRGRSPERRVRR